MLAGSRSTDVVCLDPEPITVLTFSDDAGIA